MVRNEAVLAEVRGDSTLEAHCTTATQSSHQQHHRHNIQTEHETMVQVIHRAYAGTPGVDVVRNEAVLAEFVHHGAAHRRCII